MEAVSFFEGLNVLFRALSPKESSAIDKKRNESEEEIELDDLYATAFEKDFNYTIEESRDHTSSGSRDYKLEEKKLISFTRSYAIALMKYSYGTARLERTEKEKKSPFRLKKGRKEKRDRVILVFDPELFEKMRMPNDSNVKIGEFVDVEDAFEGLAGTYAKADQEIHAIGKIEGAKIREIHPLLLDIMFMCDYSKNDDLSRTKQVILNKIITGELDYKNVSDFLEIYCDDCNEIEKAFAKCFYEDRKYVEDIMDILEKSGLLPKYSERDEEGKEKVNYQRDKMIFGNCIRVSLAKKLFRELAKEFDLGENLEIPEDTFIPLEEDINKSSYEDDEKKSIQVGMGLLRRKNVSLIQPRGMYYTEVEGKVVGCSARLDSIAITKNPQRTTHIFRRVSEEYAKRYFQETDFSKKPLTQEYSLREWLKDYLYRKRNYRKTKKAKNDRILVGDEEVISFDPEGNALLCVRDLSTSRILDIKGFLCHEIGKFDKKDMKTDEEGYDKEYNKDGINVSGIPKIFLQMIKQENYNGLDTKAAFALSFFYESKDLKSYMEKVRDLSNDKEKEKKINQLLKEKQEEVKFILKFLAKVTLKRAIKSKDYSKPNLYRNLRDGFMPDLKFDEKSINKTKRIFETIISTAKIMKIDLTEIFDMITEGQIEEKERAAKEIWGFDYNLKPRKNTDCDDKKKNVWDI